MELRKCVENYTWNGGEIVGVRILESVLRQDKFTDLPVKKIGIEMKNPPIAQTLDTDDFWRYLFSLESRKRERESLIKLSWRRLTRNTHIHTDKQTSKCYLYPYLPPATAGEAPTSLTAKRNWIAHTSRQQRFSDSDNAQRANVTSNTMAYSSTVVPNNCCWMLWNDFVPGDIFRRNISDNKARSSETVVES